MRRLWEVLLVLLGVALAFYISDSIPRATIQRDAGAAVIGLVVCIALVVLWERNRLALRFPIIRTPRASTPTHTASQTVPSLPAVARRVYSDTTPEDLVSLGHTPNLTTAERARLLQPHAGSWLRIEGLVNDVDPDPERIQVSIFIEGITEISLAYFVSDLDRVSALRKGARIRIAGKFTRLTPFDTGIVLSDCELLN
jgi:hypothetical protein